MFARFFLAGLLLAALFTADLAQAANHYIREGALGVGGCTDWSLANACANMPGTLTRGDTYYVADGTYSGGTWNASPANSGATITVKKATIADHGTDTGWDNTYGNGQAYFSGLVSQRIGNFVLDGATRNESDWFEQAAYGIKIGDGTTAHSLEIGGGCTIGGDNITIKYVFVQGFSGTFPGFDIGSYNVVTDPSGCGATTHTGLLFQRMLNRHGSNQWMPRNSTGTIIEYSAGELATGDGDNHGDVINAYYTVNDMHVRDNKFRHLYTAHCGYCGSTGWIPYCCGSSGLRVYRNWVYDFRGGDGLVGYSTCSPSDCPSDSVISQNTFDHVSIGPTGTDCCDADGGIQLGNGTSNVANNNIWMNTDAPTFTGVTHNYNAFSDASAHGEANAQQNFATSNFVNYAAQDYHLTVGTTAGTTLGSPYNVDFDGCPATTPDRGAFEFPACAGADTTAPGIPTGVTAD